MTQDLGTTISALKIDAAVLPKVLLVDDDDLALEGLRSTIAEAGFEVHVAGSGEAALASMERDFTPVVITDVKMSGIDGFALCRALRTRNWPGYVYILLLTTRDAEEDILAGLDAGADDYLSKRASGAQLLARLRTAQRFLTLERALRASVAENKQLALVDALTGLHNRRYFTRRLNLELKQARRYGGDLSLLLIDVDHFKRINDGHGHEVGDDVLRQIANRIGSCVKRETDWCARLGGEEFVVVLERTDLGGADIVAESIRRCMAESPLATGAGNTQVTVSIGAASCAAMSRGEPPSVEALLREADRCLYLSKAKGRNCVTLPTDEAPASQGTSNAPI